jgi:hypothetical protein
MVLMQTSFEHLVVPYLYSWLSSNVKDMALKANFLFFIFYCKLHYKKISGKNLDFFKPNK